MRHILTLIPAILLTAAAYAQEITVDHKLDREMTGEPIFAHRIGYIGETQFMGEWIPWFQYSDVIIFQKLTFKNARQARKYYKIANNIKKVYPIAVDIKRTIDQTVAHMDSLPDKKAKDEYMKLMEKELKKRYTPQMKKLTFSQGKLLIKLIDRQCDQTSYELIKTYMGGFKATFYNAFATLFGASLKKRYDPEVDDRLTERCILLIESGQM